MRNRIMILALVLLLGCVLPACASDNNVVTEGSLLDENQPLVYQSIQTNTQQELQQMEAVVISSQKELQQYQSEQLQTYQLDFAPVDDSAGQSLPSFIEYVERYQDDYFEQQCLLIAVLQAPIDQPHYQVSDIVADGKNGGIVYVDQTEVAGSDAVSTWHMVIELDASFADRDYTVVVNQ